MKKLKWVDPVLESRNKRTTKGSCMNGSGNSTGNCVSGDVPSGGFGNCNAGVVANACTVGNVPSPI